MKKRFNFKKSFLILMIVSLSISAVIGIFIFLFGNFKETEARLLMTTLAVGGYSLTGLCCSALYERQRVTPLTLTGMVISIAGFVFTVLMIWHVIVRNMTSMKVLVILIILAASVAQSCLLFLIKPNKLLVRGALFGTILFISVIAVMLVILVLKEFPRFWQLYFRLLGVFAILDVLGTIVTPVLNKVYSIHH